ncbi:uncharacterized protein K444DRAFT_528830 [Hyaloscypha bicolor E]|uniref:MADS-box domain-containing protein n=1 Tax=Hyaloscypha bicolor E TaxID=1095630 RepID=A0A2J6TB65_9HELO|nr:uncharacterized protein K444DRAFT_528830 [Hyaloscypha bicolor E]PMD60267.1 hypothetical protein K444DRAFT_528830 [Hyaloscypha bicolor E]
MASTQNTRGTRRKKTLIKKAHELGKFFGFEVALVIRKQGKITTYQSIDHESWWPTKAEMVGEFAYPIPEKLLPRDLEK